jgi:hypothetical protein
MKACLLSVAFFGLFVCLMSGANASGEPPTDYIKVEIRGILETGVKAKGGETTGVVIHANDVTWELDMTADKTLLEVAATLNTKTVIVTGTFQKAAGMAVKERNIVKVQTIKAAAQ